MITEKFLEVGGMAIATSIALAGAVIQHQSEQIIYAALWAGVAFLGARSALDQAAAPQQTAVCEPPSPKF